jgi:hypothetical protein
MVVPGFMEGEGLVSMGWTLYYIRVVKFIFADTEKVLNFISLFIRDLKVSLYILFFFPYFGTPARAPRPSIFETATR